LLYISQASKLLNKHYHAKLRPLTPKITITEASIQYITNSRR